jgi:uncharacterized protein (TIGR00269 family)|tara:strand:+ start:9211 stop:10134 length:924 start_codon:yes stop_codon:yes gene_type:complete
MSCRHCKNDPVISRRYSGEILCESCFYKSFEKNAQKELRKQINALIKNSDINIKRIGIGLSGGKDSTVALHILKSYIRDRNIEIVGLSVDEGIANYRSKSLECAAAECNSLDIKLEVFSYKELIGMSLGELLIEKPPQGSPCSPCGILRRRSLNQMANRSSVDCLVLGHNLDDFAQTVLMNHARGDIARLSRMAPHRFVQRGFVPRLLPLRRLPEQEIYLYSMLKGMEFYDGDCPHSKEAQRNTFRDILMKLEKEQPGTRHSLLSGMEKIRENMSKPEELTPCPSCGEPSGSPEPCVFCREFATFVV